MIREVVTRKGAEAITSDQWHVVHSRFLRGDGFVRGICSEHTGRPDCLKAAKALCTRLASQSAEVPEAERDQVFVRRPNYKSLKRVRHRRSRRV